MGRFPNRDIVSSIISLRRKRCTVVAGRVPPPGDVDSQFGSENKAVEQPSGSGLMDTFAIGQEEVGEKEYLWGNGTWREILCTK